MGVGVMDGSRTAKILREVLGHEDITNTEAIEVEQRLFAKLVTERDELRAQLARCVDALRRSQYQCSSANMSSKHHCDASIACDAVAQRHKQIIDELPKQAKLDAEVLRCAEDWYSKIKGMYGCFNLEYEKELYNSVRAVKKGIKS